VRAQASRKVEVWWSKSREEPGAHKQRHPVKQRQISIFGETGSTQFFERGFGPALFFEQRGKINATHFVQDNAAMTAPVNLIHRSFELAAERCEDLTPRVYARLFREHPETAAMFRSEGSELVKGSMLALTIDAILDFSGDRSGHFRMIECEVSSHDAYGTSRELFAAFFGVIAGTLRELLDTDWSPEIDGAWRTLLDEIEGVVRQSQT
jgi:hemoglobin-like flavoprotein